MTTDRLPMTHLRAVMPEVEAADAVYFAALATVRGNDALAAITATYNAVLLRAAEALYLDTAHVNSRDTIMQIYAAPKKDPYATHFGLNPVGVLKTNWLNRLN